MTTSGPTTVLLTVSTIAERDQLIKRILTNLNKEPDNRFTVLKPQINKIQVFHNAQHTKVLLRTYLVLVIPVLVDLKQLDSVYGKVDFHLEETIEKLSSIISHLRSLQGLRIVKGNTNAKDFEQLVRSLSN